MKIRHNHSLRKGRRCIDWQIYLVTTCCFDRKELFKDVVAGQIVANEIRRSDLSGTTHTIAFVVMPDHLHWLFQLQFGQSLSRVVGIVKGRSAFYIGKKFPYVKKAWQRGYHDRAFRRMESIKATADYVIANPLRAGLVSRISDYPLWYQEN